MPEKISEYCKLHNLSVDITYYHKRWGVKLDNYKFSTGWVYGEDLDVCVQEVIRLHNGK